VNAPWLEEKVWADVRQFLRDPGAVLERVREEIESDVASAELEAQREHASVAETTAETWLMTLRDRVEEIEEDSAGAYAKRRELVRLLVERIMVGRDENRRTSVRINSRFGPPKPPDEEDMFVNGVEYASRSLSANPGQPRGLAGRGRLSRSVAWSPRHRGRERGRAD
jgi:hypothetical protein